MPSGRPSRLSSSDPRATSRTISPPNSPRTWRSRWRAKAGGEDFALAEFYRRVADKEGVEESQAIRDARAVVLVLQDAVTTGEMDHIRDQLKGEYAELFGHKASKRRRMLPAPTSF